MDDIFIIWDDSKDQLDKCLAFIENSTDFLKFSHVFSYEKINYLDITIYKNTTEQRFETTIFRKPTYSNTLLHFSSVHPIHQKKALVKGQGVRLARMISENHEFLDQIKILKGMLINRGYPGEYVDNILQEVTKKGKMVSFFHYLVKVPTSPW